MTPINLQKEANLLALIPSPPATGAQLRDLSKEVRSALLGTHLEDRITEALERHAPNQGRSGKAYDANDERYFDRLARYIGGSLENDLSDLPEMFDLFVY